MPLKIRKFLSAAWLMTFPLLLSACLPDMPRFGGGTPETVSVSQMAATAPSPESPPLYCMIGRGSALFGKDWYDFADTRFSLIRGEHTNVKISRIRSSDEMTIQAFFDGNGQKLIFCPFLDVPPDQPISCNSIYALEDDLQDGIKRTFDIPSAVRGGGITCAYSPEKLRPLAIPAAGKK